MPGVRLFVRTNSSSRPIRRLFSMSQERGVDKVVSSDFLGWVKDRMAAFKCGAHDWSHVERVCRTAGIICRKEGGDLRVTYVAALMHDMMDSKLVPEGEDFEGLEKSLNQLERSAYEPSPVLADVIKSASDQQK